MALANQVDVAAANPVPGSTLWLSEVEMAAASIAMRAEGTCQHRWYVKVYALFDSWQLVGELETRTGTYRLTESPAVIATVGIPGARGFRLEARPVALAPTSGEQVRFELQVGTWSTPIGLVPNQRYAELVGARPRVAADAVAAGSTETVNIASGSRLVAWSMWSTGVGATVTITPAVGAAQVVSVPDAGAARGAPQLPGAMSLAFYCPLGVTGGYYVEYLE